MIVKADRIYHTGNGVPPIVSADLWEKASLTFRKRKTGGRKPNPERVYLLSGIVYYGECGSHIVGEHTNARGNRVERTVYGFTTEKKGSCENKPIRKEVLEAAVIEIIETIISPEFLAEASKTVYEKMKAITKEIPNEIATLEKRLHDTEQSAEKTVDAILELGVSDLLKKRLLSLEDEMAYVKAPIKAQKERLNLCAAPSKED